MRAHERTLERTSGLDGIPTAAIADGETIDLGGRRLEAHLTEGHAAGHLAFWLEAERALVGGDLVSALSTILIDPDHGDMDLYLASLERASALEPRTVLPGHGFPVPGKALSKARSHRLVRENRILEAMAQGRDELPSIAAKAYDDTPGAPPFLAERQALAHLLRLERTGRVRREGARWLAG